MSTIAAKWFYSGRRSSIRLICLHCTVSDEMGTGAEDVARYFANLPASKKASAHKVVDNDSVVTCVADEDTAFAAAGANSDGLHLELVGQATQTREEWLDAYSTHELAMALPVVQEWSRLYDIPLRWLTVAEVADGVTKGLTTHADVSAAFPAVSTGHWDPGPNFPRDVFPPTGAPPIPSPSENDMTPGACKTSDGVYHAFAVKKDGRLYETTYSGGATWQGPMSVDNGGSQALGQGGVGVICEHQRIDLFVIGADNRQYHAYRPVPTDPWTWEELPGDYS